MTDTTRALTVRLPEQQSDDLDLVAEADGKPRAEVIREALAEHVARRKADPEFRAWIEANLTRFRSVLERLEQT